MYMKANSFVGSPGCVCAVPTCCISNMDDQLVKWFTFEWGSTDPMN